MFYIGIGKDKRIFEPKNIKTKNKIKDIKSKGKNVIRNIIRFGLNKKDILTIEGALIDYHENVLNIKLTNRTLGHKTKERGYNAIQAFYKRNKYHNKTLNITLDEIFFHKELFDYFSKKRRAANKNDIDIEQIYKDKLQFVYDILRAYGFSKSDKIFVYIESDKVSIKFNKFNIIIQNIIQIEIKGLNTDNFLYNYLKDVFGSNLLRINDKSGNLNYLINNFSVGTYFINKRLAWIRFGQDKNKVKEDLIIKLKALK